MNSQRQKQIALALMLLGVLCLIISLGSLWWQRTDIEQYRIQPGGPHSTQTQLLSARTKLARSWLLAVGGLFILFLVASLAMARFGRRFMAYITAKPAPPTPSDDVWRMHKVPEELPDEGEDSEPDDEEPPKT